MKALSPLLLTLAGALAGAGCASAPLPFDLLPEPARGWPDAGTRSPSIALERETRYYVDEKGNVWDDRGRRQAAPRPAS